MVSKEERNTALRFIVCLGVVSLFADMTYEGAYSIIGPLFKELGASAAALGFVSGLGEMIAASLRFFLRPSRRSHTRLLDGGHLRLCAQRGGDPSNGAGR